MMHRSSDQILHDKPFEMSRESIAQFRGSTDVARSFRPIRHVFPADPRSTAFLAFHSNSRIPLPLARSPVKLGMRIHGSRKSSFT